MDVKTLWNLTQELLERVNRLWECSHEWLNNPECSGYQPHFTTEDEWTIILYVMDVLRQVQNGTVWMSNRHTVILDHIIAVYNDMFDQMNSIMPALGKVKTQWTEDLYFAVEIAR